MEFSVIRGDIAAESAETLVNAATTGLRMGSGVTGALRRAGDEALNEAAVAAGPVDLGGVAVTDAYDLDAEYVVHAAAMPAGGSATAGSIRYAARNALAAADDRGCESFVRPALGTAVAGFDFADGVRIVCEEVDAYEPASLTDVRLVACGDDEYRTLREVADAVRR